LDSFIIKKLLKKLIKISAVLLLLLSSNINALELKMPIANEIENFHSQLAMRFAAQVKKETNNRVAITVLAQNSGYKDEEIFGAVKNDLVAMGSRLLSSLDHESQLFQLDALPFLATSYRDAFNLYKVSKPELEQVLKIKEVKLLYAIPWPSQGVYTRKKIETLDDLKGLSFRPYSKLTDIFGRSLGLEPIVMPLDKLSSSIRRKQLDVVFGSAAASDTFGLSRVFSYWYNLDAWLPKEIVFISMKQWQKLSSEDQSIVLSVAQRIESEGWQRSKQVSDNGKAQLGLSKIKLEELSPQLLQEFKMKSLLVVGHWLENIGDHGRDVWERYMKL
jgi:TRAP-type C4-dicarboxylate transport system substrate-binding protein